MTNDATLIRAPQGALAWTAPDGWLYEPTEVRSSVDAGHMTLIVDDNGWLRGVTPHDGAPLAAVLRMDADLTQLVQGLGDLAERAQGLDTGLAVEMSMLKGRVRQLENRRGL
ncbi:MAG: hypothetical protein KY460_10925 [Actinobacteria bacterium]|nr:hypothetical protein [Actinomycetota bacterium]